jgi:putative salt-induced outer membrane protein
VNQAPATTGSTDVVKEGFEPSERTAEDADDATELGISAGGLVAAGNSKSVAFTGAARYRLRRSEKQLVAAASVNYGRASSDAEPGLEPTVENYQGRVRYDYFLTRRVALFLGVSARRDRFQGLRLRLNVDPGAAYYFIQSEKELFWGELGYDFQHDVRFQAALNDAAALGAVLERSESRHHGRLFFGYENSLNQAVVFNTGIEYLQGLVPFEDDTTGSINWRLNWDVGFSSRIADSFSVATTLSIKFDNNPLPGLERTDIITATNLVYSLL